MNAWESIVRTTLFNGPLHDDLRHGPLARRPRLAPFGRAKSWQHGVVVIERGPKDMNRIKRAHVLGVRRKRRHAVGFNPVGFAPAGPPTRSLAGAPCAPLRSRGSLARLARDRRLTERIQPVRGLS